MQSLKQVLEAFVKRADLESGISQQRALLIWNEVVGRAVAANTIPEKVEHGVITVRTTTPAWRQELLFRKQAIIEKLNQSLGTNTIRDIHFL